MHSWLTNNWPWFVGVLVFVSLVVVLILWRTKLGRKFNVVGSNNIALQSIENSSINIFHTKKPEWCSILEEELKRIPVSRVVFNPPEEMRVGVRERIEGCSKGRLKTKVLELYRSIQGFFEDHHRFLLNSLMRMVSIIESEIGLITDSMKNMITGWL